MTGGTGRIKLQPIEYMEIENAFLDIVEDLGIREFPVDCFYVADRLGIELVRYSELPKSFGWLGDAYEDGFSALYRKKYCIFYNDYKMEERMRFTLWYELGHITLGHFDGTSATTDARKQQVECNYFARFAQAPMPFVIMTAPDSPNDIARSFGVSYECSSYVYDKYLNVLRYRTTVKMLLNSRITRVLDFDVWGTWGVS